MKRISGITMAGVLLCGNAGLAADAQSKLPEGEAKPVVVRMCGKCHGLEWVTRARMTKERWDDVVDDMVSRGAQGTDDDVGLIVEYLAKNFGKDRPRDPPPETLPKILVNQAGAKELASALELPAEEAEAIVRYREKNGRFKEWEDLKKVRGLDTKKIEGRKERIDYAE
jgi:competence protein ComEA